MTRFQISPDRQNPLQGNPEQSTSRIKWSQRNGQEITFRTSTQTFIDPDGSLVCYRKSICLSVLSFQTFLFQQLANMGGIWKKGWKKVSPPQETPTDRPDGRHDKARAYFIYNARLLLRNHLQRAPCVDGGAECGSASVSPSPGTQDLGGKAVQCTQGYK